MKEFEIMFGDLKPGKQDKLLKEMISKIEEKYDVDISHAYDYTSDGVKIRMLDKDDNVNIRFISYHNLCINAVNYFEYQLEEMAEQLLGKKKEDDKYQKFDRKTALLVLKDLSKDMYKSCDLFGNDSLYISVYKFEAIRKKYLDNKKGVLEV